MDAQKTNEERYDDLDKANKEFHLFVSRMRKIYGFSSILVLASTDSGSQTDCCFARSGNTFASRHMAHLYAEEKFCRNENDPE